MGARLTERITELNRKVTSAHDLGSIKSYFHKAGTEGDIAAPMLLLGNGDIGDMLDRNPEIFVKSTGGTRYAGLHREYGRITPDTRHVQMHELLMEFYKGVEEKLQKETQPFEKAFVFLSTYRGFIPYGNIPGRWYKVLWAAQDLDEKIGDKRLEIGDNLKARLGKAYLNVAGVVLLKAFYKIARQTYNPENDSVEFNKEVAKFKRYLTEAIRSGHVYFPSPPIDSVGLARAGIKNPVDFLKIISRNSGLFVKRFMELHELAYDLHGQAGN